MQEPQNPAAASDGRSTVDTSRPFSSVKEAVAIFGQRFLVGEIYTPKPFNFPKKETPIFSPSPRDSSYSHETTSLSETVKKLETELENTKNEIELLKEKGSETEVALASLNAKLHKNMSKLAEAEAAAAGRAAAVRGGDAAADGGMVIIREEDKKRDGFLRMESGPSMKLAEILSIGEDEGLILGRKKEKKVMVMKKKKKKKKPIVPLVGDLFFSRKKGTSTALDNNSVYGWNI
ncbi:hypothetical protein DH2020_003027 [Rehmannia glutinosa]|uniref:WEB family protein n=1 Tax=Rehmannia glutinosa TaxID=99300 RepID=A0ABR0XKW9_REHGL